MKRLRENSSNRNFLSRVPFLAVFLLILLLPGMAEAANYTVQGRVYTAFALEEGEDMPVNPLTGIPDGQVIGDDMFAVEPRNLVKVSVIAASNGSELGSFITSYDGGYFIHFTAAGGGIDVRFVVEELATSQVLLDTDESELTLADGVVNIRYLLVLEGLSEIGNDRDFAPEPPVPPQYTGIFTRVGKIELKSNDPETGTPVDIIDSNPASPTHGQATVPPGIATQLAIHEYQDAPFGGNLYLFGAFSEELYDNSSILYRIKYVNEASETAYIKDSLVKTKYTVDFGTGEVNTERITLGPLPPAEAGGIENCYKLTPIAEGSNVFWSFPDLMALWRTGELNGKHTISIEIIDLSAADPENPVEFTPVATTELTLRLENVSPSARILALGPEDNAFPTPRVYTPGPAVTDDDLISTRLGTWTGDYGGSGSFICAILNLEGAVGSKYLAFKLKASHDNGIGYLRYWYFEYARNDTGYTVHVGKRYNGTSNSMEDYSSSVQVSSGENGTDGFTDKFIYLNTEYLQPGGGTDMGSCAYRFVIKAATRTTDGYNYLRWSHDEDIHYIQR
jgi:hypothetical protein